MDKPKYLMNTETRVVYAYSDALLAMESPKFVPVEGELPPFDLKAGQRVVKSEVVTTVNTGNCEDPKERIERICAILPMVPKEEFTEGGVPGMRAVEQLSQLKGVKRAEIKAAMKLRLDIVNVRANRAAEEANTTNEDAPAA